MKKLILTTLLFACTFVGCKHGVDMEYPEQYEGVYIENKTGSSTIKYQFNEWGKTINPGEKWGISQVQPHLGQDFTVTPYYDYINVGRETHSIIIVDEGGERVLSDAVWEKRNWSLFVEENAVRPHNNSNPLGDGNPLVHFDRALDYTLTVTDDFQPHTSTFVYKNGCSANVYAEFYKRYSWILHVDPSEVLEGEGVMSLVKFADFARPLEWSPKELETCDSVIVEMDSRRVIQRRWLDDPLYRIENYTLVSEDGYNKTYEFTFTDDFFADGEPMN